MRKRKHLEKMLDVLNGIVRAELEKVMRFERDNVGEQVLTGQRQILDDDVQSIVRVFDPRDGHVTDLVTDEDEITKLQREKEHTFSMSAGRMTLRISIHRSGLNVSFPASSNSKSFVNLAQSSPNLLLRGSSPSARNQSPVVLKRWSK